MTIGSDEELDKLKRVGRLVADGRQPAVQYEHTLVATANGPIVVTLPS